MPPAVKSSAKTKKSARTTLARKYLSGKGIEIGALARPVAALHTQVKYFDRCSENELAELYPHLADWLIPLDGITEIETLANIHDQSQDFVIACRVMEYSSNVLASFHAIRRVLRPGGIAYLSVSDKRKTADRHRPVTPLGHLAADFVHGPAGSWTGHLEEWATFIEHGAGNDPQQRLLLAVQHAHRIRQHVWTPSAWLELLLEVQKGLGFELKSWHVTSREILTILVRQ
jgi:SAM-dependent methyltransferase